MYCFLQCFLLFFNQSTSIHKIFLWANRKKPFLWKVIFRHDTFWPRAGILAGEALLFDVSWLRFLKPEFFLWFRCIRSKWCYCDHVNRPRINLQHSSFSKPMLFCKTLFWTNFLPEQTLGSCMCKTCLSFLKYLEFLTKKTSFYEKQYSAMIRFY